ncbi:hypothetical protein H6P81_009849 [Aristolochia fimbriata]|uniref:Uncharacterized protein n=1 Tax=Aristolochia fimbriata TaxID=158543 RepID=A0AAV7EMM0_ARIFI|nr:hypothetical protein H6P81_009849 [Aristolochia fimbriata]
MEQHREEAKPWWDGLRRQQQVMNQRTFRPTHVCLDVKVRTSVGGSVRKMWRRRGYQVHFLEPETLAEEELLVAPHQSNARCSHESEHLKERISNLEAELAIFRSTGDEMEARFVSTLIMHPHSSNANVEIHGHGDREDHSWGNSGGIGVPKDALSTFVNLMHPQMLVHTLKGVTLGGIGKEVGDDSRLSVYCYLAVKHIKTL